MRRPKTLREKIEERIARKRGEDVFLPREFADLGGEDQVLRVLRNLTREGRLIHLGYSVYGRAMISSISGEPTLAQRIRRRRARGAEQAGRRMGADRTRARLQ
jgi:hypothetical protein